MNKQTLWVMIAAATTTTAIMVASLGIGQASAQAGDNATTMTMGDMTVGNMTNGNSTEEIGGIAGEERFFDLGTPPPGPSENEEGDKFTP